MKTYHLAILDLRGNIMSFSIFATLSLIVISLNLYAQNCPSDMVMINNDSAASGFCIDKYEAPNIKGQKPFVARTAKEASKWCQDHGKVLCTDVMWESSCKGKQNRTYPYGNSYKQGTCNDDKKWKVVKWDLVNRYNPQRPESDIPAMLHVNSLNQSEVSGQRENCQSEDGVFDLTGNAAEWVVNTKKVPSGTNGKVYPYNMKGCYWAKCYKGINPSCGFTNPNHGETFRSYEAGFRCCLDSI